MPQIIDRGPEWTYSTITADGIQKDRTELAPYEKGSNLALKSRPRPVFDIPMSAPEKTLEQRGRSCYREFALIPASDPED